MIRSLFFLSYSIDVVTSSILHRVMFQLSLTLYLIGKNTLLFCFSLRICMATILVSLLVKQTDGIKCDSRVYCVTPEVKYISMEEIQSAYLNTTAIKKYKVKTRHSCQQLCIKENKCQAINMKSNGSTEYTCHLLDANRYSNSSLLVSSPGYIHLYIPVSLLSYPSYSSTILVGYIKTFENPNSKVVGLLSTL